MTIFIVSMCACCFVLMLLVVNQVTKRKKQKKQKSPKVAEPQTPSQPEEPKPSGEFKITKKGSITKISKKALKTDSRTAVVEPVYKRGEQNEQSAEFGQDNLGSGSQQEQEIMQAISHADGEQKVVSVKDLLDKQKQFEANQPEPEPVVEPQEEKKSNPFEITGVYGNFSVGSRKPIRQEQNPQQQPEQENVVSAKSRRRQEEQDAMENFAMLRARILQSHGMDGVVPPENPKKSDDFDLEQAVIGQAILEPKFKQKKKK